MSERPVKKRGSRQLWAGAALFCWLTILLVLGFSMSREQQTVRAELVARQGQLHELDRILQIVREGARLGCIRARDFRDQLEARRFPAIPTSRGGSKDSMQFSIVLASGENAWLDISRSDKGAWLARTGLVSGFQEMELRAWLHPIRGAR